MSKESLRTPLAKVRGLGAAGDGVQHWWLQRLTAIALLPLIFWFVVSVISLIGADRAQVAAWLDNPLAALLLILLCVAGFLHLKLGLQVVIEDYIHNEALKIAALICNLFFCVAVGGACVLSVLTLLLGS